MNKKKTHFYMIKSSTKAIYYVGILTYLNEGIQ